MEYVKKLNELVSLAETSTRQELACNRHGAERTRHGITEIIEELTEERVQLAEDLRRVVNDLHKDVLPLDPKRFQGTALVQIAPAAEKASLGVRHTASVLTHMSEELEREE